MANCLAKFFSGTSTVIDKVDFCHIFYFLLEQLLEFVLMSSCLIKHKTIASFVVLMKYLSILKMSLVRMRMSKLRFRLS